MKHLYELLNKKYDKKLVEDKEYRKAWKKRKQRLEACGVEVKDLDDVAMLYYELVAYSIDVKERFEEVFFDTYVRMYDYWYDLTYQERKKQMNLDIMRLKQELPCFVWDTQEIYMPCFQAKFNHLYTDEIILLDLKQYHTFIRSYQDQLKGDLYGCLPYELGWTSAACIAKKMNIALSYIMKAANAFIAIRIRGMRNVCPYRLKLYTGFEAKLGKCFYKMMKVG